MERPATTPGRALHIDALAGVEGLVLPVPAAWAEPVWHLFVVRTRNRELLQMRLSEAGVDTIIHYPIPPHLTGAYAGGFDGLRLPVAERLADEVLSLPMGPHLSPEDADAVAGRPRGG